MDEKEKAEKDLKVKTLLCAVDGCLYEYSETVVRGDCVVPLCKKHYPHFI